jgi:hypothetical protein
VFAAVIAFYGLNGRRLTLTNDEAYDLVISVAAGQLETNLRAAGLRLSPSETAALDAASDPHPADYPYGELGVDQRDRTLPNGH